MDADLQKVYRYGIVAAVSSVITDHTDVMKAASLNVLNEHLDREIPDNDGLRAVAEAAWREGFTYRHGLPENDTILIGRLLVSEGVPVSATDNYTPTTEEVRRSYWYNTSDSYSAALSDAEFDRWLAAERAKAWDEGRESLAADIASPLLDNMTKRQTKNPYREVQ